MESGSDRTTVVIVAGFFLAILCLVGYLGYQLDNMVDEGTLLQTLITPHSEEPVDAGVVTNGGEPSAMVDLVTYNQNTQDTWNSKTNR